MFIVTTALLHTYTLKLLVLSSISQLLNNELMYISTWTSMLLQAMQMQIPHNTIKPAKQMSLNWIIGAKTSNKRTNKLTIVVTEVIPGKLAVHAVCDSW